MNYLLLQTEHNLYYNSFYYVASVHRSTEEYQETVSEVLFVKRIEYPANRALILSNVNTGLHIQPFQKGKCIELNRGIYVILSGIVAKETPRTAREKELNDRYFVNNTRIGKGAVIGSFEYLTRDYGHHSPKASEEEEDGMQGEKRMYSKYRCKTNVICYFIREQALDLLFMKEPAALEMFGRMCVASLIRHHYHHNNNAFFASKRPYEINILCRESTWKQFENDEQFVLQRFMAFLLIGKCERIEDGRIFNEKQILLPGRYMVDGGSKMLILDHDPSVTRFNGLHAMARGMSGGRYGNRRQSCR